MLYERILLPAVSGEPATLDAYCPDLGSHNPPDWTRLCIIICGGGGYTHVSDRESEPVALRFLSMGYNAFVLRYRVAPVRFPGAAQDLAAAVAYVRSHAAGYHADPERIAVLGFSAGGHLAGTLGAMWQDTTLWSPLNLTPEQVRPNAQVLCYPVITAGPFAHRGSFAALTGSADQNVHAQYSLENLVTPQVPPTFLWSTWTDGGVPCENTLLMALALRRAGVPAEVHVFGQGHHGNSLADETTWGGDPNKLEPCCQGWPELVHDFLKRVMA